MWYTYAFYGPNILNIMLDYREVAAWIIIWVLVMIVVLTAEAWYYPDHIACVLRFNTCFVFVIFSCYNS